MTRSGRDTAIQMRNARTDDDEDEFQNPDCRPIGAHTGPLMGLTGRHGAPLGHMGGRGVASNTAEVLRLAGRSGRDTMIPTRSARADNDENKCSATRREGKSFDYTRMTGTVRTAVSTYRCTHWASDRRTRRASWTRRRQRRGVASNTAEVLRLGGRSGRDTMIQMRNARADSDENKCRATR
ncbi:hypothetical protein K438DRAFT_1777176 [Mycena galopus ATCC 62051]|nr:hypothetical protein K438DRAFT_1777176 [Mycena galopus ATCC 62051]